MADYEPPPLEDMSGSIGRLRLGRREREPTESVRQKHAKQQQDKVSLLDNSFSFEDKFKVVVEENKPEQLKESPAVLRKGFLTPKAKPRSKQPTKDHIPFVKGKAVGKPEIPDFMHVSSPMDQYRQELQSLLKPTQELVAEVLNNEGIKGGLDDPEIMAAVQDIASNPNAMEKYKNNPKVTRFYSQLGRLMGDKIEKQSKEKDK